MINRTSTPYLMIAAALIVVTLACGRATPTPAPSVPIETEVPANTVTARPPTKTPLPTETAVPTETALPTASPTQTPTPTQELPPPVGLIAYVYREPDGRQSLWLMNADGSEPREALPGEDVPGHVLWSPDGRTIAHLYYASKGDMMWDIGVKIYDLATSETKTLESHQPGPFWHLNTWSPDGKYLVLNAGTGVNSVVEIIDVAQDQVAATLDVFFVLLPQITFSPDGSQMALVADPTWPNSTFGEMKIALMIVDFLEGQSQVFLESDAEKDTYEIYDWLADGRILFNWRERKEKDDSLEIVESAWMFNPAVDGVPTPAKDLPPRLDRNEILARMPEGMQPWRYSFSPEGDWFVFSSEKQIYLVNWDTGKLIGPLAEGEFPVWQPMP